MSEAGEVVERIHQTMQHIGLGLGPQLTPLFGGPLAEVVVLGGEPEMAILEGGDLGLEPRHRLRRRLDQCPRRSQPGLLRLDSLRRTRLLRRLRLLVVVFHRFPLHWAIAMPPLARRSDGGGPSTDSEPAIAREASCQNGTGKLGTRGPRSQADGTLTSRRLSELRMPNMRVNELQHLLKHTLPLRVVQNLVIHLGIPANLHRALESVGERSP